MRNISIGSVTSDAERMMGSLLGKAESDAERERNKHPQSKAPVELNADTTGDDSGKKKLSAEEAAAEADAQRAAQEAGVVTFTDDDEEEPVPVPQAMLDMSRELQMFNAELINLGPEGTMQLLLGGQQQEIG